MVGFWLIEAQRGMVGFQKPTINGRFMSFCKSIIAILALRDTEKVKITLTVPLRYHDTVSLCRVI